MSLSVIHKKSSRCLIALIAALSMSTALASDEPENETGGYWGLSAEGGWAQLRGMDSTLYINPNQNPALINTLQQTNSANGYYLGAGVLYGYRFIPRDDDFTFANALEASLNWGRVTGTVDGTLNPSINTGTYSMPIISNKLMLDARLMAISWSFIDFFVQLGIGVAWNSVKYSDSHSSQPQMSLTINEHTQTQFAWEVGAGFRFSLTENLLLLAGYTYTDLGKATLGNQGTQANGMPINIQSVPNFSLQSHTEWLGLQWNF